MGGRKSKPVDNREYEDLKRLRDEKAKANAEELDALRRNHEEQSERMSRELNSRNADLEKLRKNLLESNVKNEEELRHIREQQARQAAELEAERAKEVAQLSKSSEEEKARVTLNYQQRAAQLKKEHDEVIRKSLAEREEEKKKRDEAIQKAEAERDEVQKQKREDVKNHREALEKMTSEHRKEIDEHFKKLNKEMEKQTLAEIGRIALETNQRMAIVDAAHVKMQQDAIQTMYNSFFKDYVLLIGRAGKLENAIEGMTEVLDVREMIESADKCSNDSNSLKSNDVPYELRGLHSEFLTESALMEQQISMMRQRLKMCFDVSDEFKEKLLQTLEPYEESCRYVRGTAVKITMAVNRNDLRALAPIQEKFINHLAVLQATIKDLNAIEYQSDVEQALRRISQKSIQQ